MQKNVKSSSVAGVLGVFLGAFGGHDWYLGNTKKAITHVSLCVGGLIFLILGVILTNLSRDIPVFNVLFVCVIIAAYVILVGNGVWGFIEGVIILAQGDAGLAAKGYQVAGAGDVSGAEKAVEGVKNFFSPKAAATEESADKKVLDEAGGAVSGGVAVTGTEAVANGNVGNIAATSAGAAGGETMNAESNSAAGGDNAAGGEVLVAKPEATELKTENRVNDVPQPTISTPGVEVNPSATGADSVAVSTETMKPAGAGASAGAAKPAETGAVGAAETVKPAVVGMAGTGMPGATGQAAGAADVAKPAAEMDAMKPVDNPDAGATTPTQTA